MSAKQAAATLEEQLTNYFTVCLSYRGRLLQKRLTVSEGLRSLQLAIEQQYSPILSDRAKELSDEIVRGRSDKPSKPRQVV